MCLRRRSTIPPFLPAVPHLTEQPARQGENVMLTVASSERIREQNGQNLLQMYTALARARW